MGIRGSFIRNGFHNPARSYEANGRRIILVPLVNGKWFAHAWGINSFSAPEFNNKSHAFQWAEAFLTLA